MVKTKQGLWREYWALAANGKPELATCERVPLDGLTYKHPEGVRPVMIDQTALASVGCVHARPDVQKALDTQGVHAALLTDAFKLLERRLKQEKLIWGVSGFAQSGFDYSVEAEALSELYKYLTETGRKPGLSVDGGVSEGNLGLNAVAAAMHNVQTLGCIPLQGLASISTRDFMIAWGDTYRDREILVGTIPDVLVCVGGSEGTRRECQAALANGSVVLLLSLKDYGETSLPATYQYFPEMGEALSDGRLLVCSFKNDLRTSIDLAWARGQHNLHRTSSRQRRIAKIKRLLEA